MNLAPGIRASLNAKLERLLARPLVARIGDDGWRENEGDATWSVRIIIDYEGTWQGCEKQVLETVTNTVEGTVTFLTDSQKALLERCPREFLALSPPPETADLVAFERENARGRPHVVELRVTEPPESRRHVHHLAIVPNLVQIERQLDALQQVENAADDGPLGPLRALLRLCDASCLQRPPRDIGDLGAPAPDETLDEYQLECVRKAMETPHLAVIEGPPGSGKTTVIAAIIRRAMACDERVLVVSPTHVAVDNVVEKLVPRPGEAGDRLEPRSLPVRYASKPAKLSPRAREYWVGPTKRLRGAAIARRVQARLTETVPFAGALFAMENADVPGHAPISGSIAQLQSVVCGTPIGILSYDLVQCADPGGFDLLIVDEVSKMTLPELLAVAVKARRWVLVGDPAQLPPFNDCEENASTLDDVLSPKVELACSVGALLERARPAARRDERLVVASSDPEPVARAVEAHLRAVFQDRVPTVGLLDAEEDPAIVVCSPDDVERARDRMPRARVLVERGVHLPEAERWLVEPRVRAQAAIFESCFGVYHAQPWAARARQRLKFLGFRNGLEKYLPSTAALEALGLDPASRSTLVEAIAARFAINTVSVYDWLTGIPALHFDTSPLRELGALSSPALAEAVHPFVGRLKKQYRMHPNLSRVPRELFYFGEALLDGSKEASAGGIALLRQVDPDEEDRESNAAEVDVVCGLLEGLDANAAGRDDGQEVMLITPYREQEALLLEATEALQRRGGLAHLELTLCTLDRCQGREAEYVFISLVRSRPSPFLDMPKRWNVALTRAKLGLIIVGNVDAYLREAREARRDVAGQGSGRPSRAPAGETRPQMSVLARIVEAYDRTSRGGGR